MFLALSLASFMGAAVALQFYRSTLYGTVLLAIATSFLATIVVFFCDRAVPRAEAKVRIIRGHREIYDSYKKHLISAADGAPMTVRTVASLPPAPEVAKDWDAFLCDFLTRNREVTYKRAMIVRENSDWTRRQSEIKDRYLLPGTLRNYKQYRATGPPAIECLLIDDATVFITFASAGRSQESAGLIVHDRRIYRELLHYFDNQLLPHCDQSSHPRE